MTRLHRDPIRPTTQGISPTAGDRVISGPLDVAAITAWTARNELVRTYYHHERARADLLDWAHAQGYRFKHGHVPFAAVKAYEAAIA